MPFDFSVVSKNGHNTPDNNSEEYKRSLLQSVHVTPAKPIKGYKVVIEFWSDGRERTGTLVAQIHKLNGEIFTVPLEVNSASSEQDLEQVNRQIHHYLFWLSQWEFHTEGAAKAWNELETLIK